MGSLNQVILVGRVGQDPSSTTTAGGLNICRIRMVTSSYGKDRTSGERKEYSEWHNVVVFGKLAETCSKWVYKGREIVVRGRLESKPKNYNGVNYTEVSVVAEDVSFLGKAPDTNSLNKRVIRNLEDEDNEPLFQDDDYNESKDSQKDLGVEEKVVTSTSQYPINSSFEVLVENGLQDDLDDIDI